MRPKISPPSQKFQPLAKFAAYALDQKPKNVLSRASDKGVHEKHTFMLTPRTGARLTFRPKKAVLRLLRPVP